MEDLYYFVAYVLTEVVYLGANIFSTIGTFLAVSHSDGGFIVLVHPAMDGCPHVDCPRHVSAYFFQ